MIYLQVKRDNLLLFKSMSINGINYRNNKKQLSRKIVKVLRISDNKDDTPIPNQSHQIENYIHNKYISNKSISKLEYDGYSSFSHKKQNMKIVLKRDVTFMTKQDPARKTPHRSPNFDKN